MKTTIELNSGIITVDLSNPIDISIPLKAGEHNVNAWYVSPVKYTPVVGDGFIGDVNQGGSVNFRDVTFNPHGNGTHTECVGHISKEPYTINQCLKQFFFSAQLVTVNPIAENGDLLITKEQLENAVGENAPEAIVIRTMPNEIEKLEKQYSNTNPPFLTVEAAEYIHQKGINHLLIDLPSVDREEDGGELNAHHVFWQYPQAPLLHRTITELIYVPEEVKDGMYLLSLQIASFENDASPSKPVLYKLLVASD